MPKTTIHPDFIMNALQEESITSFKSTAKIIWLGKPPAIEMVTKSKKGSSWQVASITFTTKKETYNIKVSEAEGEWLVSTLDLLSINNPKIHTLQELKDSYEAAGLEDFELFWDNKPINTLNKVGLLRV